LRPFRIWWPKPRPKSPSRSTVSAPRVVNMAPAPTLKVTLSPSEKARLADSGAPNIDAYDCYLRGRELLAVNPKNRERFEQSTKLFMRALELDPSYSQAYAALSMAYNLDYQNRWSDDPDNSLQLAKYNAEQAIEKDPNEPFARLVASWSAMFEKDLDRAKSEADIALSLNPNFSGAYASLGSIHTYSGRPLDAIEALERATRLDPAFRPGHLHFLGMSYLLAGKYETAAALLRERILLVPGTDFSWLLLWVILVRLMRLIASGKNLKRSIQNTPSMTISAGNLSRGKRTFSGLPRA
jgi:adenylate cyclase